jgi:hypothetical protein
MRAVGLGWGTLSCRELQCRPQKRKCASEYRDNGENLMRDASLSGLTRICTWVQCNDQLKAGLDVVLWCAFGIGPHHEGCGPGLRDSTSLPITDSAKNKNKCAFESEGVDWDSYLGAVQRPAESGTGRGLVVCIRNRTAP